MAVLRPTPACLLAALLAAVAGPRVPATAADAPGRAADTFLRDFAATRGFTLGRPAAAKPTPDGRAVLFLRAASGRDAAQELHEFNVETGETRRLLAPADVLGANAGPERVSPEERARRERQRVTAGGFTAFEISRDGSFVLLSLSGKLHILRRATGVVTELTSGEGAILDPKLSPDSKCVAYVRGHDLYVMELATHLERAVTRGGSKKLTHGLAEFVAQEEMDRPTGYWWAPDGQALCFEEADAAKVESWLVADPSKPDGPGLRTFYPRPGKANVNVRLGVAPAAGKGKTVWLDWNRERYPYLARVVWSAAGPLTLTVQTRDQTELLLLAADPLSGKTTTLLTERDPAWVNLDADMPRWLPETAGGGFLWTSERAGAWQLERHARDGALKTVLVPPAAGYRGFGGVAGKEAFFRASPDPTQAHLFRVALDGGTEPVPVNTEPGQHRAEVGGSGVFVHTASAPGAMPRTVVRRTADHAVVGELPSVAEEPGFPVRAEWVKVGPGDGIAAVIIRPRDFDPKSGRRLPVLVDVYGGPHANKVNRTMGGYLLDQWLADQGFLVVSADGRGTPGRGREWERAIGGKLGEVPLEDQVAALQALAQRFPEMDADRVGITGWSFGGYLSAFAVLRRPDVFKAAVAGAPVTDWGDYDTHYTERYLGVPPDDWRWPDAYRAASCLPAAGDLRRPLLLVHGTADDNVYFRHSLRLADALFRAGRPFEMLPLAGFTHLVPEPAVREALSRRTADFFRQHLAAPGK